MNIQALKADGPYCTLESYLRGGPWVPSSDTNIAVTFQRELAKMRTPFDVYDEVDRDHYLNFANGFKP